MAKKRVRTTAALRVMLIKLTAIATGFWIREQRGYEKVLECGQRDTAEQIQGSSVDVCWSVDSRGTIFAVSLLLLTIDLRMSVRRLFALLSANSSVLMSFSRALYLFICSQIIISTHL